jgi:hypothetical protein
MRWVVWAVLSFAISSAANAQPAPNPDYARAYAMAARCMVFNGYINDSTYSRIAFDAWKRLGQMQGLSDARMTDDMQRAIAHENVQLHQHADYRAQTQVDCRALGWAR